MRSPFSELKKTHIWQQLNLMAIVATSLPPGVTNTYFCCPPQLFAQLRKSSHVCNSIQWFLVPMEAATRLSDDWMTVYVIVENSCNMVCCCRDAVAMFFRTSPMIDRTCECQQTFSKKNPKPEREFELNVSALCVTHSSLRDSVRTQWSKVVATPIESEWMKENKTSSTHQLREESSFLRLLFVSHVLIQVVLQLQSQSVVVSPHHLQHLTRTNNILASFVRVAQVCSLQSCKTRTQTYLFLGERRQVVRRGPLIHLRSEVVDDSTNVDQCVGQSNRRLLPLTIIGGVT